MPVPTVVISPPYPPRGRRGQFCPAHGGAVKERPPNLFREGRGNLESRQQPTLAWWPVLVQKAAVCAPSPGDGGQSPAGCGPCWPCPFAGPASALSRWRPACHVGCGRSFPRTGRNAQPQLAGFRVALRLQGTQKVENILLLAILERIEVPDHGVRLGCVEGKEAPAAMRLDRLAQVRRSSIVQEE